MRGVRPLHLVRRWASTGSTTEALQRLQGAGGDNVVPVVFATLNDAAWKKEAEVQRAALKALTDYDVDDASSERIMHGWDTPEGRRVTGSEMMTRVIEDNMHDADVLTASLRTVVNLCWLTLQDTSSGSNQALLGADGAVTLAAQVLHKHGKDNVKLAERGLHALLMLTMYNEGNTTEALTCDVVNLTIAMVSDHPESLQLQDVGLALLLRLLSAPVKDSPSVDYIYEENPLTALSVFVTAVQRHPDALPVHDKFWHAFSLIAHNHASLPVMLRLFSPTLVEAVSKQLLAAALHHSHENPLRDQMLTHASSVIATLLEGETGDVDKTVLTTGAFTQVCVAAINKGVSHELDHALSSVLLCMSSREDPLIYDDSTMATLLTLLRGERPMDETKITLRTLWNVLNYHEGKRAFATLGGEKIVKDVRIHDEEMQKLIEDIQLKVQNQQQQLSE
eukprot:TRINITY_DN8857_c0_g1_i1.p1 TRINITY_DN8857_c0_g1~~TRINITY_DN8857_c0_g1_i1.p1  ORF type:complete len:450 (+),score=170.45 TRINITY_DN8857_c0_g1_i1:44-1393(+)